MDYQNYKNIQFVVTFYVNLRLINIKNKYTMTRQEKINAYLALPIVIGDKVYVKGLNYRNPEQNNIVTVKDIKDGKVIFENEKYNEDQFRLRSEVKKCTDNIGIDPFQPEIRNTTYQSNIEQILWRCGITVDKYASIYEFKVNERFEKFADPTNNSKEIDIPEICFNPIIINENGKEIEYQRGLVWNNYQKQLLIESIYNHVDIGKIVLRIRSDKWVENRVKENKIVHTAFKDLVDGKQRVSTIISFIKNEFKDLHGNYFKDLSNNSQRKFLNYKNVTYVELPETTTDKEVIRTFLSINHAGVPMSEEHINFVKSLL